MIIDMKKYLFIGAKEDLLDFFVSAQEGGFIEFITSKEKKSSDFPEPVRKLMDAIKILRKQPLKESYKGEYTLPLADDIASQVLELSSEIEKLSEEKRFLEAEISRVAPFGSFSFDDIEFIEKTARKKVQFYCVKTSKAHEVEETTPLIYIGTDYDLDYYIGIHDEQKSFPNVIEMHFDRTVEELKNHLLFVSEALHQVEAELKGFASYIDLLRDGLLGQLDIYYLGKTQKEAAFPIEGVLFSIEGWVPDNKVKKLLPLIQHKAVFFEPIAIEENDKVPTCLKNEKYSKVGEDLVLFYDTPAASDKDPSTWVFWAFILFFAMIFADGGYGLLFLALAFFLKHKFPALKASGKRLIKLLFALSIGTIIWGTLTASFFGLNLSPENPIARISPLTYIAAEKADYHFQQQDEEAKEWRGKYPSLSSSQDGYQLLSTAVGQKEGRPYYEMYEKFIDNILFELSLLIGVIHVCCSLLRYCRRHLANIGWVAFAIGAYLYLPVTLNATSMVEFLGVIKKDVAQTFGLQLLYGGIGFAVVAALIQKKLKGLIEITQLIQIFADILSYVRLYALALASTLMARTFNDLGLNVGLLMGWVIIVAGHVINITLGTMSGVIHGLRLNFIEWYRYSYEGEGKLFNPLRKLRIKQE